MGLTFVKENIKVFNEGTKEPINQLCLISWLQIEVKRILLFLNKRVVVVHEGLFDVGAHRLAQLRVNIEGFVGVLQLFHPPVDTIKLLLDKRFEVHFIVKRLCNRKHHHTEHQKPDEFQYYSKDNLRWVTRSIVSVTHGRDDLHNPVHGKHVQLVLSIPIEAI